MTVLETIRIEIEWDGSAGAFLVSGVEENGRELAAEDVRWRLFAWHEDSFYGSLLEERMVGRKPCIELPAAMAVSYWANPQPLLHGECIWPDRADELRRKAAVLLEALASGGFEPLPGAHRRRSVEWRLTNANSALDGPTDSGPSLSEWLNAAMDELLKEPGDVQVAWEQLVRAHPAVGRGAPELDPQLWLETVGFRQDASPFTVGLRLHEPEGTEGHAGMWRLTPVFVDRLTGVTYTEDELPSAWRAEAAERLASARENWKRLWPSYAERLSDDEAWSFLERGGTVLRDNGVTVQLPGWWDAVRRQKPKLYANVHAGDSSGLFGMEQLLQYDWKIAVGEQELTEEQFRQLAERGRRLAQINGNWVALDPKWVASVKEALQRKGERKTGMKLSDVLSLYWMEGRDLQPADQQDDDAERDPIRMEIRMNRMLRQWVERLSDRSTLELLPAPQGLRGDLRTYQLEGMSWLLFLRECGFGACLADDMGLGKTVQFIAYACSVKEANPGGGPMLLICPTSVLGNWQQEWKRFAPSMRTYLHYGSGRLSGEAFLGATEQADIVITSYSLALLDFDTIRMRTWEAICLDEAQNIKNPLGKQSTAIRKLQGEHKIALTGTPVENRLTELWSIFDFVNPGYLGSLRQFHRTFAVAVERRRDPEQTRKLQKLIRPFLLRRTKKDPSIQLALPDKLEQEIYVSLTAEQAALYDQVLGKLMDRIDRTSRMERRGLILSTLTKLKQICDHPALYAGEGLNGGSADLVSRSNKLMRLAEMIAEIREQGERCLVFTQYVRMGRLIALALAPICGQVPFLHGGVPKEERDALVARFQGGASDDRDDPGAFILSLKAGGTGLNLTAATHVFHFDRWWNPAVENQATDRAYRIGQTKEVQVHKFISLGTMEERIHEMIERKQALSDDIVGTGEAWITELSSHEIKDLFRLRREWVEA